MKAEPDLALVPVTSGKELSWAAIEGNFAGIPVLKMGQAWRAEEEADLREGWVRAGLAGDQLAIYAQLQDDDIYNSSRSLNEKTWTTGDAFEIFLKSENRPDYYEFHVTPENQKLQLHFPDAASFTAGKPWGSHCLAGEVFLSRTEVKQGVWQVYAEVPFDLFPEGPWRFSFCRYDFTRGREKPVLSSTSKYSVLNFHRIGDWGEMRS